MHLKTTTWRLKSGDPLLEEKLCRELKCSLVAARLLINRGVLTPAEAEFFFSGSLDDLYDPLLLKDAAEAVILIRRALDRGDKILVYGDYDVDGMTATALMVKVLQHLGGRAGYHIPERIQGYGLHAEAVRQAADDGYRLLITVDTGITAGKEIELARELGLDAVITDHHEPNGTLPNRPVVNPKRPDCLYPFKGLAGVGVAYKLGLALCPDLPPSLANELLGLVCLGTVADVVPLRGENRILVSQGLPGVNANPGLSALLAAAGINREPTMRDLAFVLSPRLNAAGRVGHARQGVDLLLADALDAPLIAAELTTLNTHRQHVEAEITAQALAEIAAWSEVPGFPVFAGEGWHPGVLGVLASRFAGRLQRPVAFLSVEGDVTRGSARSVPEVNLFQAFQDHAALFSDFGGHRQAVGFTLPSTAVPEFVERLNEHVAEAFESDTRVIEIDAEVSLNDVDMDLMEQIQGMAPWGAGNPEPVLLARGVVLRECREVGKNGGHLKMAVTDRNRNCLIRGIAFGAAEMKEEMTACQQLDLVFNPIINEWNGRRSVEIRLVDWKPAGASIIEVEQRVGTSGPRNAAAQIGQAGEVLPQDLERTFKGYACDMPSGEPIARWLVDHRSHPYRIETLRPYVENTQRVLVVVGNPQETAETWAYLAHHFRDAPPMISFLHPLLGLKQNEEQRNLCDYEEAHVLIGTPGALAGHSGEVVFVWSPPYTMMAWESIRAMGQKIVLGYGPWDMARNWSILRSLAPNREALLLVYRLARKAGGPVAVEEIHRMASKSGKAGVRLWSVQTACTVLSELGLVGDAGGGMIQLIPVEGKSYLPQSATFKRVHKIKGELYRLQRFFLSAPANDLASRLGCDIISPGG